jgi:putative SOS response-associated peptidase YedK
MCGRYTLDTSMVDLCGWYDLLEWPRSDPLGLCQPRYNIAPTQQIAIVHDRTLRLVRWGLVPSWEPTPDRGPLRINARAESAAEKPSFRAALRERRCLVPFTGFYEWQGGQPYILRPDAAPAAMAGIWERWRRDDDVLDSCAILTVPAAGGVERLHDRMPVCLPKADWDRWLGDSRLDTRAVQWSIHPVSRRLNGAAHEGPELLAPLAEQLSLF